MSRKYWDIKKSLYLWLTEPSNSSIKDGIKLATKMYPTLMRPTWLINNKIDWDKEREWLNFRRAWLINLAWRAICASPISPSSSLLGTKAATCNGEEKLKRDYPHNPEIHESDDLHDTEHDLLVFSSSFFFSFGVIHLKIVWTENIAS